jgi:allantoate deiminase
MHLRRDALAAAAEWITAVEGEARRVPGLLATVGAIAAMPGAANVIASEARVTLDVRHRSDEVREREAKGLIVLAQEIARYRGLTLRHRILSFQPSVAMSPSLLDQVEESIRRTGAEPHRMVSGAGHDAMIMAEKVPSAMIFLRTPGGVSHSPAEAVLVEDVARAIEAGSNLLALLASAPALQRRTHLA